MEASSDYKIKVIDKMFRIIDAVEQEDKPLGVNEISRKTQVNVATTFRILRALMEAGWIYQDREERYAPGYRLCSSYTMSRFYFILKDIAYCIMHRFTEQEGAVMNLCIRQNETGVLLQQTKLPRFVDYIIQVNSTLPLYATACGKILLSEIPEELLKALTDTITFNQYTDRTITNSGALLEDLRLARARGYAMDVGESLPNTCCIAVPVRGPAGEIVAALSFSGLIGSLSQEREQHYFCLLRQASEEITHQMFHLYQGKLPRTD